MELRQRLLRERFLYLNNAADYSALSDEVKINLLVERVEAMLSSENSKFLSLQQHARQQSEQQLNALLQQQGEISKQQREELRELKKFREDIEHSGLNGESKRKIELVRAGLAGNSRELKDFIKDNCILNGMSSIGSLLRVYP